MHQGACSGSSWTTRPKSGKSETTTVFTPWPSRERKAAAELLGGLKASFKNYMSSKPYTKGCLAQGRGDLSFWKCPSQTWGSFPTFSNIEGSRSSPGKALGGAKPHLPTERRSIDKFPAGSDDADGDDFFTWESTDMAAKARGSAASSTLLSPFLWASLCHLPGPRPSPTRAGKSWMEKQLEIQPGNSFK